MKCQHCNKNEATAYFKQNINGNVTEMHLCEDCAKELGLMNDFSAENFFADTFLGNLLGAGIPAMNILSGIDRCDSRGSTFNDIVSGWFGRSARIAMINLPISFSHRFLSFTEMQSMWAKTLLTPRFPMNLKAKKRRPQSNLNRSLKSLKRI